MQSLKICILVLILCACSPQLRAMTFTFALPQTVHASGPIERGDAARFKALPPFNVLELDSPGGLVGEALKIAGNIDARGDIRTVVPAGASCASACAMAIFVSGQTRVVQMGGRLGIHSCGTPEGKQAIECNQAMAANATAHGVPWGVIEGFGDYTKPDKMLWLSAEDAECWGLMKWSVQDTNDQGLACYLHATLTDGKRAPQAVDAANADDVVCRLNAGTSRAYAPSGQSAQGFSRAYRTACERIATDPTTPKYAAIDIILWLTLTDPNVRALKPGTLVFRILNGDESQADQCWKCYVIFGMSQADHGYLNDALNSLYKAELIALRQDGAMPAWLPSRIDAIAEGLRKQSH